MAGDRQAPTGTAFDPRPQFCVHEHEGEGSGLVTVTGRCWFAPVAVGTVFTALAATGHYRSPEPVPCRLRVEKFSVYDRTTDELDQSMSARLLLAGVVPTALAPESVLISADTRDAVRWRRNGSLWNRGPHQDQPLTRGSGASSRGLACAQIGGWARGAGRDGVWCFSVPVRSYGGFDRHVRAEPFRQGPGRGFRVTGPSEVNYGEGPVIQADGNLVASAAAGYDGQGAIMKFMPGTDLGCRLALYRGAIRGLRAKPGLGQIPYPLAGHGHQDKRGLGNWAAARISERESRRRSARRTSVPA